MTVAHFGRVTPLQGAILALGGVVCGVPEALVSERDRVQAMRDAKERLSRETGQAFGFDLAAWHQFLQSDERFREEYTFHYAWKAVRNQVHDLISEPERLRLVELARATQ